MAHLLEAVSGCRLVAYHQRAVRATEHERQTCPNPVRGDLASIGCSVHHGSSLNTNGAAYDHESLAHKILRCNISSSLNGPFSGKTRGFARTAVLRTSDMDYLRCGIATLLQSLQSLLRYNASCVYCQTQENEKIVPALTKA